MTLKLTVKQIAKAKTDIDLIHPVFNYGMRNAPFLTNKNDESRKLYDAFGSLRILIDELNKAEVSVKG